MLPFSAQTVSGVVWFLYGHLVESNVVIITSIASFVCGLSYSIFFAAYAAPEANWLPGTLTHHGVFVFVCTLSAIALVIWAPLETSIDGLGKAGLLISMIMFSSPLSSIRTVITARSTASMALSFTLATALNCAFWVTQGLFDNDPYIWIPNGVGAVCAAIQLALFALYGTHSTKIDRQSGLQ
jgi:solute carrier family 50 (sugar transporter)